MSFQHPWFYKAKKYPKDKDCCMNVLLLKLSSHHNRLTIRKDGIIITCLENNKTYKFLSPIILSNSIRSLISSINFLHHNYLISKQNWLYINPLLHEGVKIATPFPSLENMTRLKVVFCTEENGCWMFPENVINKIMLGCLVTDFLSNAQECIFLLKDVSDSLRYI